MDETNSNDKRTSLEIIATSVEEAIAKGLEELGVAEGAVDVDILDAGSRGLFGLGSRQAHVRLTLKGSKINVEEKAASPAIPMPIPIPVADAPDRLGVKESAPIETVVSERKEPGVDTTEGHILRVARETIEELIAKMKIKARVTARMIAAEDEQSKPVVWVDIRGDDLSILIGPKAETLNALQFIAGLIVSKELAHTISLTVDVQGYRARREQQIRQLARRMAEQAIKTGRRQVLEPMPANERRLVHMELRNHPEVTTESTGEEPRRKVMIIPKK